MTRSEFERRFEQQFERAFREADVQPNGLLQPDPGASWQKLQRPILRIARRKALRANGMRAAVVAAAILLGAGLFGNTQAVQAIHPFYESVREYPGEIYGFFFGRTDDAQWAKAKTAPPPGDAVSGGSPAVPSVREELVEAEEAKRQLSFTAPEFRYLPGQVSIDRIYIYFYANRARADDALYHLKDGSGKFLDISLRRLRQNTAPAMRTPFENVSIRKIDVDGTPAVITSSKQGVSLQIFRNHILVYISGNITEDELLKIYENM